MISRVGQVWEAKSHMNGTRAVVVMESNPTAHRAGVDAGTVHKVLHITGKKLGRVLVFTEYDSSPWEKEPNMTRLD